MTVGDKPQISILLFDRTTERERNFRLFTTDHCEASRVATQHTFSRAFGAAVGEEALSVRARASVDDAEALFPSNCLVT
jgi:hypothetical protein